MAAVVILVGLAYVMFRPVSHNLILYGVFVVMGLAGVVLLARARPYISQEFLAIGVLFAGLALYGAFRGHDNPGLVFTVLVYFFAPTLHFILASAAQFGAVLWFFRLAGMVTVTLSLLILLFVCGESGAIPQVIPDWLRDQMGLGATFNFGSTQARAYGLSSLAALGPLWTSSLVIRADHLLPHWSVRLLCALSAMAAAVVSSRMAIVLVIIIAPVLAIVVKALIRQRPFPRARYRPSTSMWLAFSAAAASVLAIFVFPRLLSAAPFATLSQAVSSFFTGRTSEGDSDQSIRSDQARQILDAWAANPILGEGFGARIQGYARTSERPWVLELQYHVLLFDTGLVGAIFVLAIATCVFVLARRAARSAPALLSSLTVALVAGVAMLIANATNPYLQAPGHFWAIFLALALANLMVGSSQPQSGIRPARLPRMAR